MTFSLEHRQKLSEHGGEIRKGKSCGKENPFYTKQQED